MAVDPHTFTDEKQLRNLIENARKLGREDIVFSCQERIAILRGQSYDSEIEKEFWIAVNMAEEFATAKNRKTTRLSRTRQKFTRVGAFQTISDLSSSPKLHDGFNILAENGRVDLCFEAIVLRHASLFDNKVVESAKNKLTAAGVDIFSIVELGGINVQA